MHIHLLSSTPRQKSDLSAAPANRHLQGHHAPAMAQQAAGDKASFSFRHLPPVGLGRHHFVPSTNGAGAGGGGTTTTPPTPSEPPKEFFKIAQMNDLKRG
jgi:hypothetical protein